MNHIASLIAQEGSQGSPLGLLIILVPFGLLIYLMVVPQRKQRARQQQLVSSLSAGDEVVTAGGIVGVINVVEDDLIHLEVDNDVVIRVAKASVSRNLSEPDEEPKGGFLSGFLGGGAKSSAATEDAGADAPVVSRRVTPKAGGTKSTDAN
ncbi:MAG: preprotein translocase subunit YajC [Actinomycetota bacterium]